MLDLRLLHPVQELPCVGGKAFDVAALSFRIERVEGERGFAGAAWPSDDNELVPGDAQR